MRRIALICLTLLMLGGGAVAMELREPGDFARWEGLLQDSSVLFEGKPSWKWDPVKAPSVRASAFPHDWSEMNCVQFSLYSAKATGRKFMLLLHSERPESEGADYFARSITLDWTGWKEFIFSAADFSSTRTPIGWSRIDSVELNASGWGNAPDPESIVWLGDFRVIRKDGPWISDNELFQMLNLDTPGMEKVKAAVDSGDLQAAKHEFAEYLRHREKPLSGFGWKVRPKLDARPANVDTTEADRVMAHDLPSVGIYHKYDGPIDWTLDPVGYREWPWQLNRHSFWVTLGRAYWATGEEKYAREFASQLQDWAAKCPAPQDSNGNASCTWRTIEAGIRTGSSWLEPFYRFLDSPSFTDEALVTMVKSFAEHARHLMRWPTNANWLTMECNGLMHIGVLFPEFKEAESWRKTAGERLYAELDRQVYPDGAQIELSTGYHQVALMNMVAAWDFAHLNGYPMPADYIAKIERMYDYDLKTSMPDGTLPGLNDAPRANIRPQLAKAFGFYPERTDFQWVATGGQKGTRPTIGSVALPFAGHLVMRTGWDPDDRYLLFDAGPLGAGHRHEDALSFVIYAHGKYQLVDAGNYAYDSSPWRRYVVSTRSHNTIMVDGLEQHRSARRETFEVSRPLPNQWIAGRGFDYASGTYRDGYGPSNLPVTHARHIFFVRPDYWIVSDFLTPPDAKPHRYESLFHLDAEGAQSDEASKAVRSTNKTDPNLSILPLDDGKLTVRIVSGQETPTVQGWLPKGSTSVYEVRPIPVPIFQKEVSGPTSFLYVFYPTKSGAECPVARVERIGIKGDPGTQATGAAIRFADGRTDYFAQVSRPGGRLRFQDFETDAQAALVRMDAGGRITGAFLAGGTGITHKGKALPAEVQPIQDLSKTEERHRM